MKSGKGIIVLTLIISLFISLSPQKIVAQSATDQVPPVPVSDSAMRTKEVGVTIFGFTIPGLTLDSIIIMAAKQLIGQMVDSTVDWINSGFDGNPAYATDPKKYFTDIADNIAGEFIAGSDLAFLCSPFKLQIQLGLTAYHTRQKQFQCTLSDIAENIGDFANDLDEKGWDNWLVVTQNPTNNPYGAYLEAQIELDRRIAERIGIEDKQLSWGEGFLSWSECTKWEELHGPTENGEPLKGACLERGPTQTPGTVINDQLGKTLGTGFTQLELADEFDEIVGALIGQLLQQLVFTSEDGLFSNNQTNYQGDTYIAPPSSYAAPNSCSNGRRDTNETGIDSGGVCDTTPNVGGINTCPVNFGFVLNADGSCTWGGTGTNTGGSCPTSIGYVYNPTTGMCVFVGTGGGGGTVPNNYGCIGSGCAPCSGSSCGVGTTEFGDPALNGEEADSCRINIVDSFQSSVHMTVAQCALVNQTIVDDIVFGTSPSTGLPYVISGGTRNDAIEAIALVCGGNGGGTNRGNNYLYTDSIHYICGFP